MNLQRFMRGNYTVLLHQLWLCRVKLANANKGFEKLQDAVRLTGAVKTYRWDRGISKEGNEMRDEKASR
uniref:Uncharacterized protein n=1 Tax=Rhodnius prolixus TaxID=13249 RepID=T1HTT5_RHOPR